MSDRRPAGLLGNDPERLYAAYLNLMEMMAAERDNRGQMRGIEGKVYDRLKQHHQSGDYDERGNFNPFIPRRVY